jgi:hypothetical protein
METEFDDVCYIVNSDDGGPVNWKVIRDTQNYEPIFRIQYYSLHSKQYMETIYKFEMMKLINDDYAHYYKFIRSEQEYLLWCLKNADRIR